MTRPPARSGTPAAPGSRPRIRARASAVGNPHPSSQCHAGRRSQAGISRILVTVNSYRDWSPLRCGSRRLAEQAFEKSRALINRSQDGQTAEPEILLCAGVVRRNPALRSIPNGGSVRVALGER